MNRDLTPVPPFPPKKQGKWGGRGETGRGTQDKTGGREGDGGGNMGKQGEFSGGETGFNSNPKP